MQLNMGEGKLSVIVPIVTAALANETWSSSCASRKAAIPIDVPDVGLQTRRRRRSESRVSQTELVATEDNTKVRETKCGTT